MSIRDNTCDFCEVGEVGTNTAVAFYLEGKPVVWDGFCRNGSALYFSDFTSEEMKFLIEHSEEALVQSPIDYGEPEDLHIKKIWIRDEVFRAKQELVYRVMESV